MVLVQCWPLAVSWFCLPFVLNYQREIGLLANYHTWQFPVTKLWPWSSASWSSFRFRTEGFAWTSSNIMSKVKPICNHADAISPQLGKSERTIPNNFCSVRCAIKNLEDSSANDFETVQSALKIWWNRWKKKRRYLLNKIHEDALKQVIALEKQSIQSRQ